ncbi:30S RIBOSOMAL PROTEIN S10, putative [Babesia bigemina]|uniref:30S RIBOSOMAL PROTEIN S10, putative n=1 Tax=Babesia bigemina TaxID=5866 RepID=A0A061D9P6_BABBI|nr:30S RIBOSOMAL PROTEIN S10, putative [Babesia bigemina]CDR97411.1 30S RIBOSOMAL PROTEIN S10, putative [Babesia bigemina]|eukprot:XP_012769597.1 30S RIBOSOMAL PROTEIN S10, putative [Babesia bigemina]
MILVLALCLAVASAVRLRERCGAGLASPCIAAVPAPQSSTLCAGRYINLARGVGSQCVGGEALCFAGAPALDGLPSFCHAGAAYGGSYEPRSRCEQQGGAKYRHSGYGAAVDTAATAHKQHRHGPVTSQLWAEGSVGSYYDVLSDDPIALEEQEDVDIDDDVDVEDDVDTDEDEPDSDVDLEDVDDLAGDFTATTVDSASTPPKAGATVPGITGRFGSPGFIAGTSSIAAAAQSKLRSFFNWRSSDSSSTDDRSDASVDSQTGDGDQRIPPRRERRPYHSSKPYGEADMLDLPYVLSRNVNMSLDRWPDNCFLRIRLESYYPFLLRFSADRLIKGIREHTNLRVGNVKAMPMRRKRWCLLSSPHVDKRSKDIYEIQQHVRFLDVFPAPKPARNSGPSAEGDGTGDSAHEGDNDSGMDADTSAEDIPEDAEGDEQRYDRERQQESDAMKFKGLLMVPLPNFVSFDYWFEEVHKHVKNRSIEKTFRRRIWVSKYFRHHYEKREKAELVDKLTSPELYSQIPLRHKRHPCDYFALQLGELRKLYDFVVRRKAEDEARERYGVPGPKFYDIDEVRFVPNEDDRRCGHLPDDADVDTEVSKQMAAMEKAENANARRK